MIDFFGWANVSMPQEYITTSKAAVMNMANHLDKKEGEGEKMELMRDIEK